MKHIKRSVQDIKNEIKYEKQSHEKKFGKRNYENKFIPLLLSGKEIESLMHISFLEGYLDAMRDERRKK